MNWNPHEEERIKRYWLGDLPVAERRAIEDRLIGESDYDELARLIEQELIDDYARGALSESDQALFVRNFILTPERRAQLSLARQAVQYASALLPIAPQRDALSDAAQPKPKTPGGSADKGAASGAGWWRRVFAAPVTPLGALAALVLAVGIGGWLWWSRSSAPATELARAAVAQASATQRSLEPRMSNLNYAPFPRLMGGASRAIKVLDLERAAGRLRRQLERRPDAEAHYELGRIYLLTKQFTAARAEFDAALRLSEAAKQTPARLQPLQARMHNDLGVTLLELWRLERSSGPPPAGAELEEQSLTQFTTALVLDERLLEARFNQALLYQQAERVEQARAAWDEYLARETDARWIAEAKQNRELLQ